MNADTATAGMAIAKTATLEQRWQRLREKLVAARPSLLKNGCVVSRQISLSTRAWTLRYRQGRRLRAIYIGPEELATRVRQLIRDWRAAAVEPETRRRNEMLTWLTMAGTARGYTGRAHRRLRQAIRRSAADPRAALALAVRLQHGDAAIERGKPPGRPAAARLW